jgi:hypothetical protein
MTGMDGDTGIAGAAAPGPGEIGIGNWPGELAGHGRIPGGGVAVVMRDCVRDRSVSLAGTVASVRNSFVP